MKKLRLSVNLKVSIGIMLIMICVGIIGLQVFMVTQEKSALDGNSLSTYETVTDLQDFRIDLARIDEYATEYALSYDESARLEYEQLRSKLTTDFVSVTDTTIPEETISQMQTTLGLIPAQLRQVESKVVEKESENTETESENVEAATKETSEILYEPDAGLRYVDELDLQLTQSIAQQRQELESQQAAAQAKSQELIVWIIFGTILCGSAALFTAWIVVVSVTRPLVKLNTVIDAISKGDITTQISEKVLQKTDEIGDLARSFDRTMVSLKLAIQRTQKVDSEEKEK